LGSAVLGTATNTNFQNRFKLDCSCIDTWITVGGKILHFPLEE